MATSTQISKMRTAAVIQKMKEKRYDPLEALIEVAQETQDKALRVDIATTLMKYCYPQLKHVEVDAQVNHGISVQVRQFIKPSNVIQMENPDARTAIPTGQKLIQGESEAECDPIKAGLPVGAGGHRDIIPDPEIPTKSRKTR